MSAIQLEFGLSYEECENKSIRIEVKEIATSLDKVRKKLFAENGETKECLKTVIYLLTDLIKRVEIIERGICNNLIDY